MNPLFFGAIAAAIGTVFESMARSLGGLFSGIIGIIIAIAVVIGLWTVGTGFVGNTFIRPLRDSYLVAHNRHPLPKNLNEVAWNGMHYNGYRSESDHNYGTIVTVQYKNDSPLPINSAEIHCNAVFDVGDGSTEASTTGMIMPGNTAQVRMTFANQPSVRNVGCYVGKIDMPFKSWWNGLPDKYAN
jgi:hypothetical protein